MAFRWIAQFVLGLVLVVLGIVFWELYPILIRHLRSTLLDLPGPPSPHWFFGNLKEIYNSDDKVILDEWIEKYGPHILYRGFLNVPRLLTVDTRALNHILTHSTEYHKPEAARRNLSHLLGNGVLFTEGEQHRQQRRVLNPAFGPTQIRELTDIFVSKSIELRDLWASVIAAQGEVARFNVMKGLSKMTLDVIGLAGFNYDLDTLNPNSKPGELARAFQDLFDIPDKIPVVMIIHNFLPGLRPFIHNKRTREADKAREVMRRIGSQLIAKKKAEILRESKEKDGSAENRNTRSRDLLTLLIKANMETDITDNQRLSDEDVLAQVPTFLIAGHETTSTATTWCLFALTQDLRVQDKLREELLTVETDTPTMDELNALPYLDMVVREALRVHAPVPTTMRVAMKDDIIPLDEPFTDKNGNVKDGIRVNKGTHIIVPISTMNRLKTIWGEDADEFKPERWESPPEAISNIPVCGATSSRSWEGLARASDTGSASSR